MLIYMNSKWGATDIFRQISRDTKTNSRARFTSDTSIACKADYIITNDIEEIARFKHIKSNHTKIVYIFMENPEILRVELLGENAPDIIISPYKHETDRDTTYIKHPPCVPWFYGIEFSTSHGLLHIPQVSRMDLDKIMKIKYPKKKKLLSIICSGKNMTWDISGGSRWQVLLNNILDTM